jgi:uncharacterized membrane protein
MSRWQIALILITALLWIGALSAYFGGYDRLPQRVPTHFNAHGEADQWTDRSALLLFWLIMPAMATFLALMAMLLPRVWPAAVAMPGIQSRFETLLCIAIAMMAAVEVMVIASSFEVKIDFGRWVLALVFATIGVMGLGMRNLPRNPILGIRLPWTLQSDAVWDAVHRGASRIYLAVGAVGVAAAAVGMLSGPVGIAAAVIILLLSVGVFPIFYSLLVARTMKS